MMAHPIINRLMTRNRWLLVSVIVLAAAIIFSVRLYNKPHRSVGSASPDFRLSATELVEAFISDEARANSAYGGKVIAVSGTIREVIADSSGSILVMGDTTMDTSVSCYLQEEQADVVHGLRSGDAVTVKGVCNGLVMDVMIDHAVVMPMQTDKGGS